MLSVSTALPTGVRSVTLHSNMVISASEQVIDRDWGTSWLLLYAPVIFCIRILLLSLELLCLLGCLLARLGFLLALHMCSPIRHMSKLPFLLIHLQAAHLFALNLAHAPVLIVRQSSHADFIRSARVKLELAKSSQNVESR